MLKDWSPGSILRSPVARRAAASAASRPGGTASAFRVYGVSLSCSCSDCATSAQREDLFLARPFVGLSSRPVLKSRFRQLVVAAPDGPGLLLHLAEQHEHDHLHEPRTRNTGIRHMLITGIDTMLITSMNMLNRAAR